MEVEEGEKEREMEEERKKERKERLLYYESFSLPTRVFQTHMCVL